MSANSIVQSTADLLSNRPRRRKESSKKKVPDLSAECIRMFQIFDGVLSRKGNSALKSIQRECQRKPVTLTCNEEQPVVDLSIADELVGDSAAPNEVSLGANHNEAYKRKEFPPLQPIPPSQSKNNFKEERLERKKSGQAKTRDTVHTSGTWEPPTVFLDPSSILLEIRHSSLVPSEPPSQNDFPNKKQKLAKHFNNSPRKSRIPDRCGPTAESQSAARLRIPESDSIGKKSFTSKNDKPDDVTLFRKKTTSYLDHISKYVDDQSRVTSTVPNLAQKFLSSVQDNPVFNVTSNAFEKCKAVPNSSGAPLATATGAASEFSSSSKETSNKCQYRRKVVRGTHNNVNDNPEPINLHSSKLIGGKSSIDVSSPRMQNFMKIIIDNDPVSKRLLSRNQKMSQAAPTKMPTFLTSDTKEDAAKKMMGKYALLHWLRSLSGSSGTQQQLQDDRPLSEKGEKFEAGTSQCDNLLLEEALDREIESISKSLQPQPRGTEVCSVPPFPVSSESYLETFHLPALNVMNGRMKSRARGWHSQEPHCGDKLTATLSSSQKNDVTMQAGSLFLNRAVPNATRIRHGCLRRLLDEPGRIYHTDAEPVKKIRKSADYNTEHREPSVINKVLNDSSHAAWSMQGENSGDPLGDENFSPPKPTTVIYFKSEPASDDENSGSDGNERSRLETSPLPVEEDVLEGEGVSTKDFIKEEYDPEEAISSKEIQKQNKNVDVDVRIKEEVVLENEPESPKLSSHRNEIFDDRLPRRSQTCLQTEIGNGNGIMDEKTVDIPSPSLVASEDYQNAAVAGVTPQIKIEPESEDEDMMESTNEDRILSEVPPNPSWQSREGITGSDVSIMIKTEREYDNEDQSGGTNIQSRDRAVTNLTCRMDSKAESGCSEVSATVCRGRRDGRGGKNAVVAETYFEGGDDLNKSHKEINIASGMSMDPTYDTGCYIKTEEASNSNVLMDTGNYNVNDLVTENLLNNMSQNESETEATLNSVFESEFQDEYPTLQQKKNEKTDISQSVSGFQNKRKTRQTIKNIRSLINMRENPGTSLILSRLKRETTGLKGFSFDACELPKPYVVKNSTEPVETRDQQSQTEIISALVCEPLMSYEQLTDEKLFFFTGVNKLKFAVLQGFVFSNYRCVTWKYLSEENQLLLTLFKYRHKPGIDYLSVLFGISESRVSQIISRVTKNFSISVNEETLWAMKKYKGSLSLVIECREFISCTLKAAYPELSPSELSSVSELHQVK